MLRRIRGLIHDVIIGSPIRDKIFIPVFGEEIVTAVGKLLKEDGDSLLLESGDNLLLEG